MKVLPRATLFSSIRLVDNHAVISTSLVVDKTLTPSPWTTHDGLPKMNYLYKIPFQMSTIGRTAIYIFTMHIPSLFSSARPLRAERLSLLFCVEQLFI